MISPADLKRFFSAPSCLGIGLGLFFLVSPVFAEPFQVKIGRMFAQGQNGALEEAVLQKLEEEPDQKDLWLELADLRKSRGDYEGTVAAYQNYLASVKDWKVQVDLALTLEQMGKFLNAKSDLEGLNKSHPDDPDILWGLARLCLYQSKWKSIRTQDSPRAALADAQKYLLQLTGLKPGFALGLWQLAGVSRSLGDRDRALRAYEAAVKQDASYKFAHRAMAEILARDGRYSQSLAKFEQAMAIEPDDAALKKEAAAVATKAPQTARKRKEQRLKQWEEWKAPAETVIASSPVTLRVGLATGLGNLLFRGVSDLQVLTPGAAGRDPAQAPLATLKVGQDYRVVYVPAARSPSGKDSWTLQDAEGKVRVAFSRRIWIAPVKPEDPVVLHAVQANAGYFFAREEDRAYRGIVEILPRPGKGFNAINRVSLEDYTAGVLPAEMISSWPMEALEAQAIVARTYALSKSGRHNDEGFDVCSSVHCQVYGGLRSEEERSNEAVRATAGLVLKHGSKMLPVVFSAECGGHTQDYEEAWGYKLPVVGVEDYDPKWNPDMQFPLSPARMERWIKEDRPAYCRQEDLRGYQNYRWAALVPASYLEKRLPEVGRVRRMTVTHRSSAGWADTLLVEGDGGQREVKGDIIRRFLGGVRSNLIWIEPQFDPKGWPEEFIIYGGGWGHGVGMCQVGCYGLAKLGKKYGEILKHYFPKGDIRKLEPPK